MRFELDYTLQEVYYNRCTSEGGDSLAIQNKKAEDNQIFPNGKFGCH